MIEGVKIKSLKVIPDERGRLMEILRADDEMFECFGQVYMTTNYPGVVKAWHYHHHQSDNVACLKGMIKLVLHDPRPDSPTKDATEEYFIGEHRPLLIHIPPFVYHGWKCISETESVVINIPTQVYRYTDPDEHRVSWDDPEIGYDWSRKFF
ncbi:MAG: dTDP-4-dehydrorhamnose 3,5-epimerase [Calditrichaeota bacterium]|nr:dTDP-4-dehydrorhamnose 3,5-epimerase [Calditrichota bacterium]